MLCTLKLEDEVCNGGPKVWKGLEKLLAGCPKPCRVSSYDESLIEKVGMTYMKDTENEASFVFDNLETRPIGILILYFKISQLDSDNL